MDSFTTFLQIFNAGDRDDEIREINDEIQELISTGHFNGSSVLLKKLSDLDRVVRKDV